MESYFLYILCPASAPVNRTKVGNTVLEREPVGEERNSKGGRIKKDKRNKLKK
jgi:hypothetical protein